MFFLFCFFVLLDIHGLDWMGWTFFEVPDDKATRSLSLFLLFSYDPPSMPYLLAIRRRRSTTPLFSCIIFPSAHTHLSVVVVFSFSEAFSTYHTSFYL